MNQSASRRPSPRRSGGERVFADDRGLLWSAAHSPGTEDGAVVFSCITDSRQAVRAIAVEAAFVLRDVEDDTLRLWLREAPKIGRLS